jgi:anti-sigma-K factor RskA
LDQETQIRHYLLGILAPEQQQEVEESILTNDEQLSLVEMLEDELVDDYVQGLLSPSERTHFEQHFLCVEERRAKVRFARILSSYGKMQPAGSSVSSRARPSNQFIAAWRMLTPAWELSVVALVLGLIVATSWLAVSNSRLAANLRAIRQGGDR